MRCRNLSSFNKDFMYGWGTALRTHVEHTLRGSGKSSNPKLHAGPLRSGRLRGRHMN